MKNPFRIASKKFIFFIAVFLVGSSTVNAQFEQKLTINLSGAFIVPEITSENSIFQNGLGVDGGLQYNLNTHLSIIANGRFYFTFPNNDHPDAYMDNLAFGGGLKINLAPNFVLNPYLFGEANINFLWFEDFYEYAEPIIDEFGYIDTGEYEEDFGTSIGGFGGAGLDFKISNNLALYIQSGIYYTNYDSRLNIYNQVGLRINLIKSKTI